MLELSLAVTETLRAVMLELAVVELLSPIPAETVLVIELIVSPAVPANCPLDPPIPRETD